MALSVPFEVVLVRGIVAVGKMPRGDLVSASLIVGVWYRMSLEYLDVTLTVYPIEMISEASYGVG